MAIELRDFETKVTKAVQIFWQSRNKAKQAQIDSGRIDQGERGSVTAGKNLDGFIELVEDVVRDNGLSNAEIFKSGNKLTLPGYYRPTKLWDLLVFNESKLVAALEFKSQVGSFGNNFNNRTEEALGTAHDVKTAFREGAFGDQRAPFFGWLMLLEEAEQSKKPVKADCPNFNVFPDFVGASYADRYDILCRRMVQENLYSAAAIVLSPKTALSDGENNSVSQLTSVRNFFAQLAGHIAVEAAQEP